MYDEELEKIMLFHIIFNNYVCDLTEKDFVDRKNVIIIKAINKLKKEKQDINLINIQEKIQRNNSKILEYLVKLGDYGIGTEADTIYNKIIQLSQKRAIYNLLKENMITVTEKTAEETYTDLIDKTNKIMQRNEKEETFIEQISKTSEEIEKSYKNRNDYSLYTGISVLDDKILGLHNGELTIIGARPGVGKTTFALQIAQKIAERKKKVAILSLEMSDVQLIQKLISKKTGVNSYKMRSGNLVDDDWDKIAEGIGELSDLPIRIITKAFNIQQIEKTIRKLKNKNELDLVVIDYIQLIKNQGNFSSREQQVADISRTLKLLTLELNIPIIALCQLNRNANKTEPTLADLRESGSIEQDADNVFFLYQEKEQDTPIVDIVLKIAKQRNGEIGKVFLKFNKPKSEFVGQVRW